jgi:ribonuclease D
MSDLPETIVTRPEELEECCAHLSTCSVIGFDTEFIGESSYHPRLCLVQVATPERLFLLDPLALHTLEPFLELVADPNRVSVVHAGREEIRMCRQNYGTPPGNTFDLQIAAGLIGAGYPAGHAALVQQFLRVRLDKGETLTDWARRPLTPHQIRYAYDDVRHLLFLYEQISGKLKALGRSEWATEEFRVLERRWLADDPDLEPWRKLRGLGSLDGKRLAVVREVYAWREGLAARLNRPARFLLRDDLIVEVAKRMPKSERDLSVLRGLPKRDFADLLAAVARALASDPHAYPVAYERENDPPQVGLVTSLLQAVLGAFCSQEKLTQSLVATTADLKQLVRARISGQEAPEDSNLTRGWRAKHVLPVLLEVLDGRRAVKIGDLNSTTPFQIEPR